MAEAVAGFGLGLGLTFRLDDEQRAVETAALVCAWGGLGVGLGIGLGLGVRIQG